LAPPGWPAARLVVRLALAPTLLALGGYAAIDQAHASFANFTSVLERLPDGARLAPAAKLSAGLSPFVLCIALDPLRAPGGIVAPLRSPAPARPVGGAAVAGLPALRHVV
jgi:hypothetical protein